jgi:hypothetical protein
MVLFSSSAALVSFAVLGRINVVRVSRGRWVLHQRDSKAPQVSSWRLVTYLVTLGMLEVARCVDTEVLQLGTLQHLLCAGIS